MNILIIDNEKTMLETLKRGLKIKGFNVFDAPTITTALETLSNFNIDMVITDYAMPQMNGIELTKKIKETEDIPVILMSAHGEQELMERAEASLCNGFLLKPFTLDSLIQEIHRQSSA